MWNFFRHRAIKERATRMTKARFTEARSRASFESPEAYQRVLEEEQEAIKEAIKRAIENDIGDRRNIRRVNRAIREQNKLATPREQKRISQKISTLSAELRKLEDTHERNYKKSNIEALERQERELLRKFNGLSSDAKYRFESAESATTRKDRRIYNQEGRELQKRADRAKREYDKVKNQLDQVGKRLDKKNNPILEKTYALRAEIQDLERKLETQYFLDRGRSKPQRKTGGKIGEVERETLAIYDNIDAIKAKLGRFNHIQDKIKRLKREYEFKTRYIEGERDRARDRRHENAQRWYKKNIEPLYRKLEQDDKNRYGKERSELYNALHRLDRRLRELEPRLQEEIAEREEISLREAQERKQLQLAKQAREKINSLLQNENF